MRKSIVKMADFGGCFWICCIFFEGQNDEAQGFISDIKTYQFDGLRGHVVSVDILVKLIKNVSNRTGYVQTRSCKCLKRLLESEPELCLLLYHVEFVITWNVGRRPWNWDESKEREWIKPPASNRNAPGRVPAYVCQHKWFNCFVIHGLIPFRMPSRKRSSIIGTKIWEMGLVSWQELAWW